MTGDDTVAAQLPGTLQQLAEFQKTVAVDAGIGRSAGIVGVNEFIHNLPIEVVSEIKNIVGDFQPPRHRAGILHIVQGAAGFAAIGSSGLPGVQPHGGTDAVAALLFHQQGSHGAVHAAAHSNQGFHGMTSFLFRVYQSGWGKSIFFMTLGGGYRRID